MIHTKFLRFIPIAILASAATPLAKALTVSPPLIINTVGILSPGSGQTLSGTLPNQGTPLEIPFTLSSPGAFTAYTTSYANGGFEPNLTLYDSMGQYVDSQVGPGASPLATVNSTTGLALDGYIHEASLSAGSYTLTATDFLLQQSPTATSLADGFTFNLGSGDITFIDEQGNSLNGNYSIALAAGVVPEPTSAVLLCIASIALVVKLRYPKLR